MFLIAVYKVRDGEVLLKTSAQGRENKAPSVLNSANIWTAKSTEAQLGRGANMSEHRVRSGESSSGPKASAGVVTKVDGVKFGASKFPGTSLWSEDLMPRCRKKIYIFGVIWDEFPSGENVAGCCTAEVFFAEVWCHDPGEEASSCCASPSQTPRNFCSTPSSSLLGGGMTAFGWGCGSADVAACCSNGSWGCWGGLDWRSAGEEIDGTHHPFLVSRASHHPRHCDRISWCSLALSWLAVVACPHLSRRERAVFYDCVCVEVKSASSWWLIVLACVGLFLPYDKTPHLSRIRCCFQISNTNRPSKLFCME